MALVPTPPTFGGQAIATSSQENQFRDATNFLQKPPLAELIQSVAQSIPNTAYTALTFTSHTVDQDYLGGAGHSDSVNTSRYTANFAGWYQVSGGISYAANATARRLVIFAVNGSNVFYSATALAATAALGTSVPARTKMLYLNVGDYVELMAYQESGGALFTAAGAAVETPSFSIRWVSN